MLLTWHSADVIRRLGFYHIKLSFSTIRHGNTTMFVLFKSGQALSSKFLNSFGAKLYISSLILLRKVIQSGFSITAVDWDSRP
jgi:hypothetical protein